MTKEFEQLFVIKVAGERIFLISIMRKKLSSY